MSLLIAHLAIQSLHHTGQLVTPSVSGGVKIHALLVGDQMDDRGVGTDVRDGLHQTVESGPAPSIGIGHG